MARKLIGFRRMVIYGSVGNAVMAPSLKFVRSQFVYEAVFDRPVFDRAAAPGRMVAAIYDELAPSWGLALKDIQILQGANLGASGVRVGLFNGLATIDILLDRYVATFNRVQNRADEDIVVDCLKRLEASLAAGQTHFSVASGTATINAWYECDGGGGAVKAVLDGLAGGLSGIAGEFDDGLQVDYSLGISLRHTDEKWVVDLRLERSVVADSHLFAYCRATYHQGGRYDSFEQRRPHITGLIGQLLVRSGFTLQ